MTGIFIEGSTINIGVTGSGGSGWSPIGAAFDADYTRGRYSDSGMASTFGDLHSLTRASAGTAFDFAGNLQSFASGVARVTDRGLLIEEARTNSIRNNTMAGAVAGAPGSAPTNWTIDAFTIENGLSRQLVGTGTENGIDYIDIRFSGTATASDGLDIFLDAANGIAASVGQTWTISSFVKLQAGTLAGISPVMGVYEYSSVPAFLAGTTPAFTLTGSLTRVAYTRTNVNASTAFIRPLLRLNYTNAADIDITLRIGLPQLELGAFATSPIKTTGSGPSMRQRDDILAPGRFASLAQSSFYVEYEDILGAIGTGRVPFMNAFSANERHFVAAQASNKVEFNNVVGGVTNVQNASSGNAALGITKVAGRVSLNDCATQFNALLGGNLATDTVCPMPTGANTIYVGSSVSGTAFLNGYLRRLTFFPRKLTDAELSALVAA